MNTLAFGLGSLGTTDMIIILVIALLVFGKRLPEVGKSLGKGIVEFKKGLKGVEEEVDARSNPRPPEDYRRDLPPAQPDYRAPLPPVDDRRVSHDVRSDRPADTRDYRDQHGAPQAPYAQPPYAQPPQQPYPPRDPYVGGGR